MIEYKVRPVTRWEITRYENSGGSGVVCEVLGMAIAEEVGRSLAERDGGTFTSYGPESLADVPQLLRRIAGQVEDGTWKAHTGVLSLRAKGQRRPVVFGFGVSVDGVAECQKASEEIKRLQEPPRIKS